MCQRCFRIYEVPMKAGQSSTAISLVAWQTTWGASRFVFFWQPGLPWLPIAGWGNLSHRPAQLQDLLPFATIWNGLCFLLSGKVSRIKTLEVCIKCSFLHQNFLDSPKF